MGKWFTALELARMGAIYKTCSDSYGGFRLPFEENQIDTHLKKKSQDLDEDDGLKSILSPQVTKINIQKAQPPITGSMSPIPSSQTQPRNRGITFFSTLSLGLPLSV